MFYVIEIHACSYFKYANLTERFFSVNKEALLKQNIYMVKLGVHIVRISPDFNNLISPQIVQQKPQSRQFLYHGPIPVFAHRSIPKNKNGELKYNV